MYYEEYNKKLLDLCEFYGANYSGTLGIYFCSNYEAIAGAIIGSMAQLLNKNPDASRIDLISGVEKAINDIAGRMGIKSRVDKASKSLATDFVDHYLRTKKMPEQKGQLPKEIVPDIEKSVIPELEKIISNNRNKP